MADAIKTRRDFLVSIRPIYAEQILQGAKTVELRRRFTDEVETGAVLLIYSSSPRQAIIGWGVIVGVKRLQLANLWKAFGKAACLAKEDFDAYFEGLDRGYAILLRDVKPFSRAVTAAVLHKRFGFIPPQSFMYLRQEHYPLLNHERTKTSN